VVKLFLFASFSHHEGCFSNSRQPSAISPKQQTISPNQSTSASKKRFFSASSASSAVNGFHTTRTLRGIFFVARASCP
jgi:hypothetical protein